MSSTISICKLPLTKIMLFFFKEIIVGGITGNMFWHHLHIDLLWFEKVPEEKVIEVNR